MPVITAAGGNKKHCVACIERMISPKDEREMRKGYQGSAKERGAEGAACLRQDYLMVCRYLIRISKYTLRANLPL